MVDEPLVVEPAPAAEPPEIPELPLPPDGKLVVDGEGEGNGVFVFVGDGVGVGVGDTVVVGEGDGLPESPEAADNTSLAKTVTAEPCPVYAA